MIDEQDLFNIEYLKQQTTSAPYFLNNNCAVLSFEDFYLRFYFSDFDGGIADETYSGQMTVLYGSVTFELYGFTESMIGETVIHKQCDGYVKVMPGEFEILSSGLLMPGSTIQTHESTYMNIKGGPAIISCEYDKRGAAVKHSVGNSDDKDFSVEYIWENMQKVLDRLMPNEFNVMRKKSTTL